MKRIAAMILVMAMFLCACSAQINSENVSQTNQNKPVDSTADNKAWSKSGAFHMALPCDITVYGSGNDAGFYEVFANDDTSKNIMYTDYATLSQVYLCSKPSCAHDNESCTSWIKPMGGTVYPVALNGRLALIYSNRDDFSRIELADANGSNRHTLMEFASGVEVEPGAAVNDEYIVVQLNSYSTLEDGNVEKTPSLVAINFQTGKMEELYTCTPFVGGNPSEPGTVSLFFRGVTDTGFIVKTIHVNDYTVDENMDPNQAFEVATQALEHTVYEIPFDGGDIKQLLNYKQDEYYEEPYGEYLFFLKNNGEGQYALEKINTQTMEQTTVVPDFSQTNIQTPIPNNKFSEVFLRGRVNEHVIVNVLASNTLKDNGDIELVFQNYAINIDTGEMKELGLSNYYSATQVPVEIVAQFGDKLLVHAKIDEVRTEKSAMPVTQRSLGIISKEDYLASAPNYQMIASVRKAI